MAIKDGDTLLLEIINDQVILRPMKTIFQLGIEVRQISEISVEELEKGSEEMQKILYDSNNSVITSKQKAFGSGIETSRELIKLDIKNYEKIARIAQGVEKLFEQEKRKGEIPIKLDGVLKEFLEERRAR